MIEVRFRPLPVWPHPVTSPRSGVPFSAPYNRTLGLLDTELRALRASNVIIAAGFREADIRRDGLPKAAARPTSHPGVELSFDSKFGRLVYATDRYEAGYYGDMPSWQANLRAIALSLQALRAVDRYGVSTRGQQYAGWKALTTGSGDPTTTEEAWQVLYRAAGLEKEGPLIKARYTPRDLFLQAAKRSHPDASGNAETFRRVEAARRLLEGAA